MDQSEGRRDQLILAWTKWFNQNPPNLHLENCPVPFNRCRLTTNRSLIKESDAVIFHTYDMNLTSDMPTFRSPLQRWCYFAMESPMHSGSEKDLQNLPPHFRFNWTLTYRLNLKLLIKDKPVDKIVTILD